MLYIVDLINNHWVNIPVTIQDIKRILSECKIIDIEAKEPFPEGKVTIVGVGNDDYECHTFYDMEYTDHMKLTYGGYFNEDHSGWNAWWTMNYNYSDEYDKTKAYIVDNADDGNKLAKFLNFVGGLKNIENTIQKKKDELKKIQEELSYLDEARKFLNLTKHDVQSN